MKVAAINSSRRGGHSHLLFVFDRLDLVKWSECLLRGGAHSHPLPWVEST